MKVPVLFTTFLFFLILIPSISAISWNVQSTSFNIANSNLTDLGDVNATSPNNGDLLVWNATTARWEAGNISTAGGGSTSLWEEDSGTLEPINKTMNVNLSADLILKTNVSQITNSKNTIWMIFEDNMLGVWG